MTKLMPTGIKKQPSTSWLEMNLLLETVNLDDEIGHVLVADITFVEKGAIECNYMYTMPIIIEK